MTLECQESHSSWRQTRHGCCFCDPITSGHYTWDRIVARQLSRSNPRPPGARASLVYHEIILYRRSSLCSLLAAMLLRQLLPEKTGATAPRLQKHSNVLFLQNCCFLLSCSIQATFLGQPRYRAWISTLAHRYFNSHIRRMTGCGKCIGNN